MKNNKTNEEQWDSLLLNLKKDFRFRDAELEVSPVLPPSSQKENKWWKQKESTLSVFTFFFARIRKKSSNKLLLSVFCATRRLRSSHAKRRWLLRQVCLQNVFEKKHWEVRHSGVFLTLTLWNWSFLVPKHLLPSWEWRKPKYHRNSRLSKAFFICLHNGTRIAIYCYGPLQGKCTFYPKPTRLNTLHEPTLTIYFIRQKQMQK